MKEPSIPDYEILGNCGCGAFGEVWRAKDRYGAPRAAKTLDKRRLAALGCLDKEERGLAALRAKAPKHEGILEIFHIGETPDFVYYVMELADDANRGKGQYQPDSLSSRLAKGPLPPQAALSLVKTLLSAISALHDAGLVHRDVKPSNILFCGGAPKLADFGLLSFDAKDLSLAGTAGFIPPDAASRSRGQAMDLYAAGKVLYCSLTGLDADKFPSLPSDIKPGGSPLIALLNRTALKACSPNEAERFATAKDFLAALDEDASNGCGRRKGKILAWAMATAIGLALGIGAHFLLQDRTVAKSPSPQERPATGKESLEAAIENCKQDLGTFHPQAAYAKLRALELSQPKEAQESPEFVSLKKKAKDMAEDAVDFGGDAAYAKAMASIAKAGTDPRQALKEMDALWNSSEVKKALPLVQSYTELLDLAGRRDEALRAYRSLPIEAHRNLKSASMLKARAEFLWKLGLKDEAARDIATAAILNPKDAAIRSEKAVYMAEASNPKQTQADAERTIRELPDSKSAAKIKESLRNRME